LIHGLSRSDSWVKRHFHAPFFQSQTSVWRSLYSLGLPRTTILTFAVTSATFPNKRTLGSETSCAFSNLCPDLIPLGKTSGPSAMSPCEVMTAQSLSSMRTIPRVSLFCNAVANCWSAARAFSTVGPVESIWRPAVANIVTDPSTNAPMTTMIRRATFDFII
jgi:hypothetical protein